MAECPVHKTEMRVIADTDGTREECDQCEIAAAQKDKKILHS